MLRVALKGIAHHKMRLVLTAMSIALGVSFVAGTFIFTDTIDNTFTTLFTDVYSGVDVSVRAEKPERGAATGTFDESLLQSVAKVPGVDRAVPSADGFAQLLTRDGNPIGGQGPPTIGTSWSDEPAMSAARIEPGNGRGASAPGEVVIDAGTAKAQKFAIGDPIDIAFQSGKETFTIVGIVSFGSADNLAGATLAIFDLKEAQRLFGMPGKLTGISIAAARGVDRTQLTTAVGATLPAGLEAVTGNQQTKETLDQITTAMGFISTALLAFAAVAVLVGAFIIQNTFRITVAQRTREIALLRAIGASDRQVTAMVVIEAAVVGLIASVVGVGLGVLIALGIRGGMDAVGIGLPGGSLVFEPRTVLVALAVGLVVTLLSVVLPARRAAGVAPMAALRDAETTQRRSLRGRAIVGSVLTGLGAGVLALALTGHMTNQTLGVVAAGALAVFLGVSVLAAIAARPAARFLGWPLPRVFGVPGALAQSNTARTPRRTASTASALMIGLALVTFVAVFAQSMKTSVDDRLAASFPADFSIQASNQQVGVSQDYLAKVTALPQLGIVVPVGMTTLSINGHDSQVSIIDPATIEQVYDMKADRRVAELGSGIFVNEGAIKGGMRVGDSVTVKGDLGETTLKVTGAFKDETVGSYFISEQTATGLVRPAEPRVAFVKVAKGAAPADARTAMNAIGASFPTIKVQDASEVAAQVGTQVDQMLALFQGLLLLAIIIAILGVANTLALSVAERTRELGLLRAVGMSRVQVRRMVRWEAVLIAAFGALLGITLGISLAWAVLKAMADQGITAIGIPYASIALYLVLAGLAGVVAAIGPARRASRIDILKAIATE